MLKFKIGDLVKHNGRDARVTATSGTDGEVIVRYKDGRVSKWLPQDEVTLAPKEPEKEPEKSRTDKDG